MKKDQRYVTRLEFNRLSRAMTSLAKAQARTDREIQKLMKTQTRTDREMQKLIKAQTRTDRELQKLMKAQTRTDQEIQKLTKAQARTDLVIKDIRRELGSIGNRLGAWFETIVAVALPKYLKRINGINCEGFYQRFVSKTEEVNLYAKGMKDSRQIDIFVEATIRAHKKDVTICKTKANREKRAGKRMVRFLICQWADPGVKEFGIEKGINVITYLELLQYL